MKVLLPFALALVAAFSSNAAMSQKVKAPVATALDRTNGEASRRIATTLEHQNSQAMPDRGCHPGADDRRSDLCAQWKAADAASDAAQAAERQTIIGWIGLALGGVTMMAAIAAALYARRAAIANEASVAIGTTAAKVSEDAAQMQLRAYLGLHPLEMDQLVPGRPTFPDLVITIENYGSTPVKNWTVLWNWQATDEKPTTELFDKLMAGKIKTDWQHSFAPHTIKATHWPLKISEEYKGMVVADTHQLYVVGQIQYIDVFGAERTTDFFYKYRHNGKPRFGQIKCRNSMS